MYDNYQIVLFEEGVVKGWNLAEVRGCNEYCASTYVSFSSFIMQMSAVFHHFCYGVFHISKGYARFSLLLYHHVPCI